MHLHSVNMTAEWSRCPYSMTQCARDNVAPYSMTQRARDRRGASPDPCRTPVLRRGNLLRLQLAVVRVKL